MILNYGLLFQNVESMIDNFVRGFPPLSPEAGSSFRWSPRGPLWVSFCFIFWWFFFPPTEKKFYIDGRVVSQKTMYFGHFSKTNGYFFLVVFRPLRSGWVTFSVKNSRKKSNYIFFKKFRTIWFFPWFFRFFEEKKMVFSKYLKN